MPEASEDGAGSLTQPHLIQPSSENLRSHEAECLEEAPDAPKFAPIVVGLDFSLFFAFLEPGNSVKEMRHGSKTPESMISQA